ncbi:hypothetical protein HYX18_03340 [Candidatus Woesearchaeota archaeon]|nr:hypothetical protein [Candidatus Woesearchaeota archaeon]
MEKRGAITETSFAIFGIFAVALILVVLINYINNISNDNDFKQRYIVRDNGLLLETMQNSPGDIFVDYKLGNVYQYIINRDDNSILIKSKNIEIGKKYFFVDNKLIQLNSRLLETDYLIFEKNESKIDIRGG